MSGLERTAHAVSGLEGTTDAASNGGPGTPGAAVTLRFTGALAALSETDRRELLDRGRPAADPALERIRGEVAAILARVRGDGDVALLELAQQFDHVTLAAIEVPRDACAAALAALDPGLRQALERAARNLATFHRAQLPPPLEVTTEPGVTLGRRADPLARLGIYAPGGRASYPSSVLMAAVPARVAGVGEIVLCSPPDRSGRPAAAVLAAAAIAGVDRVFALGGSGAIGAMAYGTATVPRVDRIVGPGNAWVAEAKLAVSSTVAIDSPAGPSEILVIADGTADPDRVAAELLAQAEHDPLACAIALVLDGLEAAAVERALATRLASDPAYAERRAVTALALAGRGGVLAATSRAAAIEFANAFAPEHLLLAVADAGAALAQVRHAGTVLLGDGASVAFGDYLTGANHVLPTGGFARAFSGLSVLDCLRFTTWQRIDRNAAARLAADVVTFAGAEGLPGHAAAAQAAATGPGAAVAGTGAATDAATPRGSNANASGHGAPTTSEAPGGPGARAIFDSIQLYAPGRLPCEIDLSDNTNAFGAAPAARRVLRAASHDAVSRYPSVYSDGLREALARYTGAQAGEIVTGCGSDDVIDSALRAFAAPGERVAYMDPTFTMVPAFARMNGLEPVAVPLGADFDADADALLATGARVIYLCSPNNPTGTRLRDATFDRIVRNAPGLVILDQAYAEFVAPAAGAPAAAPAARLGAAIPRAPRLLVVRTLSKAFGLAGLRVGYGVADAAIAEAVAKSRGPFKVGAGAERAGVAALDDGLDWVTRSVLAVRRNRAWFTRQLRDRGIAVPKSEANFVLVPVRDAAHANRTLRDRGVAARPFAALHGVGDALRITIGRRATMRRVLDTLDALASELGLGTEGRS